MKKLFTLVFGFVLSQHTFGQLNAGNDTTICAGTGVQLSATGGTTYSWSPNTSLNGANTATPVATPTVTTTYVVTSPISTANIVTNGSFAQGNTGFTSEYTYDSLTNVSGSGGYHVGSSPNQWNTNMTACNDRSSGDANMLIVNGSTTAGTKIWCQTHSVYPNTTYNLSAYFQELHNQNYPILQWNVNGTNVGNSTQAIFFVCIFTNAPATWNSGINTSATFCLVGGNTQANGNDFGIDDISITPSGNMTDTIVVTVANAPTVNLGNDTAICTGQSLVLDARNAGATYQWSDNTTAQTRTITTPGNYPVTVTAGSCSATDAVEVNAFVLDITTAAVNTTCGLDNGQASVVPNNGTGPYNYTWNNTGNTDTIWNLSGGTYTVTVNDGNSCSATGSAIVNTSGAGNVIITDSISQICATDSALICAPSGYITYLWNNGATSDCIRPSLAGNYYVTVTDNANCTSTSNHVAVSVYQVPPVSISVSGDTLRAFNASAYQWYFNGNEITSATTDVYIATQVGSYSVKVTDVNGCVAISNPVVVTGITDLSSAGIRLFPNPNLTGSWQLIADNTLIGKPFDVTDMNGKTVFSSVIQSAVSKIEMRLSAGVYLLKIKAGETTYQHKLIKL